jgi:uncharacterized integral membrane protein (TIGR00697 family)
MNRRLVVALTIYLTSLWASNTLGLKLMPFLFGTHLSVAVFFFPFVFLTTDVVGQIYGKKMARSFVFAGFVSTLLFIIYSAISTITSWSADSLWVKDAYDLIFGVSMRISIASLLAFVIGEYQDVLVFFALKDKKIAKNFWLRSTISNIWSQFLDTFIFMFVAFWGIYSLQTIILAGIPWWIYKVVMGAAYSPLSYLGLRLLREENSTAQNPTTQ